MTSDETADRLRQELKDVDEELAELRRVAGDVAARRGQDSDTSIGLQEPEEIATELTGLAETEAVIDTLEQRRERIEARIRELS